jgi:hypothetical protein
VRTGPRLLAAAALLGGVAVAVVVLLLVKGQGGGGGDDGASAHPVAAKPTPAAAAKAKLPAVAKVRNAKPQPGWKPYSGAVPILRYDAVGTAKPGESFPELFVPPADFRAQMDWLASHGYEGVGLETVQAAWSENATLPPKPIVLSFDGVDADLLKVVVPELTHRGWPAVLVVDPETPPPSAVVARLIALGWDLEPSGPDPAAARRFVNSHFPAAAQDFAFPPAGSPSPPTTAVKEAGFHGATVSTGGGFAEASGPFAMPRITIFGLSKIEGFEEALRSRGQGVGA